MLSFLGILCLFEIIILTSGETISDFESTTDFSINVDENTSWEKNRNSTNPNNNVCPELYGNYDVYNQNTFLDLLLDPCRYDKSIIPTKDGPLDVNVRLEISFTQVVTETQLLHSRLLLELNYVDPRLEFLHLSPTREELIGGVSLIKRLWLPHIYVPNEKKSALMGLVNNDVYVMISARGRVSLQKRIILTTNCFMTLVRFPFDQQTCNLEFEVWAYNTDKLIMKWGGKNPIVIENHLHLTEFDLLDYKTEEITNKRALGYEVDGREFSSLAVKLRFSRQIGYYLLDFFIPSILLVMTSWVSFWLQADSAPARVALGTSTMLSFITLTLGQYSSFPKTPYVTFGEIWFIGCTIFIFLSITEFAFANVIWRRKKDVELLKTNSKYILQSALTPRLVRQNVYNTLHKSGSCTSLASSNEDRSPNPYKKKMRSISVPAKNMVNGKIGEEGTSSITLNVPDREEIAHIQQNPPVTCLTPQEIAIWIDRKSRFVFPLCFVLFNFIYWTVVLLT